MIINFFFVCFSHTDRFPINRPHILDKWKLATNVDEPKLLRVCSLHFTPDSFNENGHLLKRAVPTRHLSAEPKDPDATHPHHKTLKRSPEPINHQPSPKRKHLCQISTNLKANQPPPNNQHLSMISTNLTANQDQSTRSVGVQVGHTVEQYRKREDKNEKRLNRLKVQVHRQKKKLRTLGDELANLKKQKLLTDDAYELINCKFGEISLELFQNELKNSDESSKQWRYSDKIKQFAVTLHFYSPQAYNFIREHLHLPHPRSINEWVSSVDCHPGMLDAVFLHLQKRCEKDPSMADCCLIFDAMAIKKDATPNAATKSYECMENYGGIAEEPGGKVAKEALVLMVASLTGSWKYPIAYFFTSNLSAANQTKMVKEALIRLADAGMRVHSVTCDCSYVNQDTARQLGVDLNPFSLVSVFDHPTLPHQQLHFLFDPCHLLKLTRNLLGDYKVLKHIDCTGRIHLIKWSYIQALDDLQQTQFLNIANKIKGNHIKYTKHKMKVKLAAQVFSSSVADAIDFLREDIKHPSFAGSEATVTFIRNIDMLFDFLNTRNPFAKGYKRPLSKSNRHIWYPSLLRIREYLLQLRNCNGELLSMGKRKTCIIGWGITITGIIAMTDSLLYRTVESLRYFLTFKTSQDRLEIFFSKIRRRGGWNNNPTTMQFTWSLRHILLKNFIAPSKNGNCTLLELDEDDSIFSFRWCKRRYDSIPNDETSIDDNLLRALQRSELPDTLKDHCIYYIAGWIARTLSEKLHCQKCKDALFLQREDGDHNYSLSAYLPDAARLTVRKNRGGLMFPSSGVYEVVKMADRAFR